MAYRAVIFDMDGLMLDSERMARDAWRRALADWGLALPDDVYFQLIGREAADTKAILARAYGPALPVEEAYARKQRYLEEGMLHGGIPTKPGLHALLDLLDARGIRKAVASSTHRPLVVQKLELTHLLERFEVVVCGDEVRNGKPAPDVFLLAAERLGVPARDCIVLEDSEPGIRAARAAGMTPILVPDLKPPSPEIAALTHRVLPSLDAVREYLAALLEEEPSYADHRPATG
ncbi:MAG: HAD family phosphatase [Anaerolineae bacterium]|nr:HAD family phosphatase [Anaerolineae bacterium]